ncbi:MAG TPA: sialidase family protein [Sphingobacteriaceae bacterium]
MRRIFQLSALYLLIFMMGSCRSSTEKYDVQNISGLGLEETAPFLTTDHLGNAVLAWTSKDPADSLNRLMYAIYDSDTDKFSEPVVISVSAGTKSSSESMNKVAFKSDGTVMAVFARRFNNEKNPFAGAICYSMSRDKGLNWSPAQYLHSDTAHAYGRGYFDVSTLKNGEVGAIWLDGRYKKTLKGSAIFYSATQKGAGFKRDTCVNKNTCECCRTDLLTDMQGNIHLAYRSILFPETLTNKQVRDIVYTGSNDNGKTFTSEKVISKDNWSIDGCPHTGPSLAVAKNGLNAVWYTAGGTPGLYYSRTSVNGTDFNERKLLTTSGRHPQMIVLPDGKLAVIYEEASDDSHKHTEKANEKHSPSGMDHHEEATGTKIILRVINGEKAERTLTITEGKYSDHHAVLVPVKDGLLAAWVREKEGRPGICFTRIKAL